MREIIGYNINNKRQVTLRLTGDRGGYWITLNKREILALAEEIKKGDFIAQNWNVQALSKKYKSKKYE